jgi:hypothetical protein
MLTMFHSLFILADVGSAFTGVAKLLAGFLGGVMAFVLVVEGYMYLAAMDDVQKAAHGKRAIGAAIVGGILVALATMGLATDLVNAFGK